MIHSGKLIPGIAVICMLCLAFAASSQDMITKSYLPENGLNGFVVYSAIQDKHGFIWLASETGVARFDGNRFHHYSLADGLGDNVVFRMGVDSKNRVWFMGAKGTLSYYQHGKFHSVNNDTILARIQPRRPFNYFFEDKYHRLWFSSPTSGIVLDMQLREIQDKVFTDTKGIPMNSAVNGTYLIPNGDVPLIHFHEDGKVSHISRRYAKNTNDDYTYLGDGRVLFRSPEGIVEQNDTIETLILPLDKKLDSFRLSSILFAKNSKLWLSFPGKGIMCFDLKNPSKAPRLYFENLRTTSVTADNEDNIWVGTTDNGIFCLQPWDGIAINYLNPEGLDDGAYMSIAKDNRGNVYLGMTRGSVRKITDTGIRTVRQFDERNPIVQVLIHDSDQYYRSTNSITHAKGENGRAYNLKFFDFRSQPLAAPRLGGMCRFKNGLAACTNRFVSIDSDLFSKPPGESRLQPLWDSFRNTSNVYADKAGTLWFIDAGDLYSYDGKGITRHATLKEHVTERIRGIGETADSSLIFCSYGEGVFFYKNDSITGKFTEKDGLASNMTTLTFVHNNDVYITTVRGITIFRYNKGKYSSVRQLNTGSGMASNSALSVWADDTGVYAVTSAGITIYDPGQAGKPLKPPVLHIVAVKCKDSALIVDSAYTLTHDQNFLHFEFVGICFRSSGNVNYQYKFKEDQPWIATTNTSVDASQLRPGNYTFTVRARIFNGEWSAPKSFSFVINPPFWKTTWFIAILLLVFTALTIAVIWYIVTRNAKREKEKLEIESQITNLEQQALQAMMNPHFIFNVMNSIQHYINNNNQHEANVYLSDFAKLIRMNLEISSKRFIPLDDEVGYLNLYLTLERLRFDNRLTYSINVDTNIDGDETMIPVMLLQPFIENAIWHGILPKKEPGHIQVDIKKEPGNMIRVSITDNGVGMSGIFAVSSETTKKHVSHGMKITRHRLDLLSRISGQEFSLNIHDAFPGERYKGTRVELLLPADLD